MSTAAIVGLLVALVVGGAVVWYVIDRKRRSESLQAVSRLCDHLSAEGPAPAYIQNYCGYLRSAGTLPPFAASFTITCLCSQIFIGAVSFRSPV